MRVLYDARLAPRGLGISTFIVALARALVSTGQVQLVWLGDPELTPEGAHSFVRMDRAPYALLDAAAGRALACRLGADVIHFTGNTGWACRGPLPSVLTLHDLIFLDSRPAGRSLRQLVGHRYERLLVPRAARAADVLVVPSRTVAGQVQGRLGARPRIVYGGVSGPHGDRPAAGEGAAPRGQNTEPAYIVAFAGRDPRKQTEAVVSAWRRLAPTGLRLHLLAAGGMPPGMRASLAPELAAGTVTIHPHLPRERLWALLESATALVYPSTDEGFGLPVLEGMAAGTPVLTGLAAATREVGGDAIMQLDPSDLAGSIVAALRRLMTNRQESLEIRWRGLDRAREFSWELAAAGYLAAYHEAIELRR